MVSHNGSEANKHNLLNRTFLNRKKVSLIASVKSNSTTNKLNNEMNIIENGFGY